MIGQTLFQFVDMEVAKILAQPRYGNSLTELTKFMGNYFLVIYLYSRENA